MTIQSYPWALWCIWFALGSCLGSFLNVCIYRLPREQSIIRPRSRCTKCRRQIAAYDNIPFISYVILGGRCRHCRKRISLRYPLIEAMTGLATIAVFQRFGMSGIGLVYLAFVCALITASFIDLEFRIIPDEISLGGLVLGIVVSGLMPSLHGTESRWLALGRSIIGLLVGGGLLYGFGIIGDFIFKKESMGGGDIKLLAMAGSILGWKLALLTFFISSMLAVIPGLVVLFVKRSHVIPFGPFLSLGLVLSLFFGQGLIRASGVAESVQILWSYYGWRR